MVPFQQHSEISTDEALDLLMSKERRKLIL